MLVSPFHGAVVGALSIFLSASFTLAQTVDFTLVSSAGTHDLGPGYTAEPAYFYNGTVPGPLLRVTEGQPVRLRYVNQLAVEDSIVHLHGQPVNFGMDGAGGISRPSVAPGQEFRYQYDNLRPGTYWYHPHSENFHHQIDRGMYGVFIVDPLNTTNEPAYDVEQVIVLDDWYGPGGSSFSGHLMNGKNSGGQVPISVGMGHRLKLRIVNTSFRTNYVIALDGHPMTVTHSDGHRLQDLAIDAIPVGIGERYQVIIECNNPGTWSLAVSRTQDRSTTVVRGIVQYSGQTGAPPSSSFVPANLSSGSLLSYSQLASFDPSPIVVPDRIAPMALSMQMAPQQAFLINNEAWPVITPTVVNHGDVVQMDYTSNMMGQSWHPMHLHGHSVRLKGTAGGTTHAPVKDVVLLRPAGQLWASASVQFDADNPGRWLMHCHDMNHMMSGMMTSIDYAGDTDGDGIPDSRDMEPTADTPVLTLSENGADFLPGGSGLIGLQWQPGEVCTLLVSLFERNPPQLFPPAGLLYLADVAPFGAMVVGANEVGSWPYGLPNSPILSGLTINMQGFCGTSLLGGLRFSTFQPLTIR